MPIDDYEVEIRLFDPTQHERAGFDCGEKRLNNFLKLTAKKQHRDDITRVYVMLRSGQTQILGYNSINMGTIDAEKMSNLPRGAPAHGQLPCIFLSMVAIDVSVQGKGLGGILLNHVFEKAKVVANQVGCYAIVLDVMSDGGTEKFKRRKAWYNSFGFHSFPSNPSRMFITLKEVRGISPAETEVAK